MKVVFTGGGTGGHIFPIIAVIRELKKSPMGSKIKFYYLGSKDKFGRELLKKENVKVRTIISGKIRRYGGISIFQNFIDILFKIPLGIIQSFIYLFFINPDLVFSKGGYGSVPVVISAWFLRIPIFIHESDTVLGAANKLASKLCSEIFASFPLRESEKIPLKKVLIVGNPIREEILGGRREEATKFFNLQGGKPLIFIMEGSQGAERINDIILNILPKLLASFEVIHQCGENNIKEVKKEAEVMIDKNLERYYHLYSFLGEKGLKLAFAAADIIISRAGSGSIFEIAASGKPSILIPLPEAAQNHQIRNAYSFAKDGASIVIEEGVLKPYSFLQQIKNLAEDKKTMELMSKKAKEFAKPKAADIISQYILTYLTQK